MTAFGDPFSYNAPPGPPWVRQLHQMIYKILLQSSRSRSCRFESVVRTDSLNHARLSWRAYLLILYFTGDLPELPSGRAGANGNI
eukprot:7163-Pleurochrysis_carterae.AAC.1